MLSMPFICCLYLQPCWPLFRKYVGTTSRPSPNPRRLRPVSGSAEGLLILQQGVFFLPNFFKSYELSLTHHLVCLFWQRHRGFCLVAYSYSCVGLNTAYILWETHQYAESDAEWHAGGKRETREYSYIFGVSKWVSNAMNLNSSGYLSGVKSAINVCVCVRWIWKVQFTQITKKSVFSFVCAHSI